VLVQRALPVGAALFVHPPAQRQHRLPRCAFAFGRVVGAVVRAWGAVVS
jgi:hypothetical protein